jgi:hypothetical protein
VGTTVPSRQSLLVAPVEVARRGQGPAAAIGELEEASPSVGRIRSAPQVAAAGHVLDQLAGSLLADPEPVSQCARGQGCGVEGPEHIAVRAGEVVEPSLAQVDVQLADELLVCQGEQDTKVGFRHGASI